MNDETLIELLESQAKKGWILDSSNHLYLTFKNSYSQPLKYQVNYNSSTKEYTQILNTLGYQFVCSINEKDIYMNEDVDAEDIYNDETTQCMAALQHYSIRKIIGEIIMIMLFSLHFYIRSDTFFLTNYTTLKESLLLNTSFYALLTLTISIIFNSLIKTFYLIYFYRFYKKKLSHPYNLNKFPKRSFTFYKYNSFLDTVFSTSIIIPIIMYIMTSYSSIMYYIAFLFLFIIGLTPLFATTKYYRVIQCSIIVFMIGFSFLAYKNLQFDQINKELYYHNLLDETSINKNLDLLSKSLSSDIVYTDYYENQITCLNSSIAYEVFQEEVKKIETYSRESSYISHNFLTFEESIKNMNSIHNKYIDGGYYNQNYLVFYKDNLVVSMRIEDKENISKYIQYYIE